MISTVVYLFHISVPNPPKEFHAFLQYSGFQYIEITWSNPEYKFSGYHIVLKPIGGFDFVPKPETKSLDIIPNDNGVYSITVEDPVPGITYEASIVTLSREVESKKLSETLATCIYIVKVKI